MLNLSLVIPRHCKKLEPYPLDTTFIAFPVLGAAAFFVLITLASYWLTGHRSLVSSSLIAFFGPIEMAATLYQFLYTLLDDDRNFVPIRIGLICVFCCGVILNLVFIVHFHKQVKGTDKEFERWRKRKWCASNCCLLSFPQTVFPLLSDLHYLERLHHIV